MFLLQNDHTNRPIVLYWSHVLSVAPVLQFGTIYHDRSSQTFHTWHDLLSGCQRLNCDRVAYTYHRWFVSCDHSALAITHWMNDRTCTNNRIIIIIIIIMTGNWTKFNIPACPQPTPSNPSNLGGFSTSTTSFLSELGRRLSSVSNNPNETSTCSSGFQWRFNALIQCFCMTLFQTTH